MSENSKIEWTDHTFNPWERCQKVGPGCDHCYAETRNARFSGGVAANWGPGAPRRRTSPANWRKPLAWNRNAGVFYAQHRRRQRVFCASLADVFENAVDPQWREDLFALIRATPNLDWLLLTKRIGNVAAMVSTIPGWLPDNVWLGTTIVNQAEADRDIPKLLAVPALVRFLSMEPLLGPVDIMKWLDPWTCSMCGYHGSEKDSGPCMCADCGIEAKYDESIGSARCPQCGKDDGTSDDVGDTCPTCQSVRGWSRDYSFKFDRERPLDWVIVGGESGQHARPMHPDWARSLRDQCAAAGVPFLFKQWGEWGQYVNEDHYTHCGEELHAHAWVDSVSGSHGKCWLVDDDGTWSNWTGEPPRSGDNVDGTVAPTVAVMGWHGKKAAGRLLDSVQHDGSPNAGDQ